MEAITSTVKTSPVTPPLGLGAQSTPQQPKIKLEAAPQPQQVESPITEQELQQAITEVNTALTESNVSIGFNYEQKLGQLYVQVTDNLSGEVIRELPSKDFIEIKLAMREMIGLLLDKEV